MKYSLIILLFTLSLTCADPIIYRIDGSNNCSIPNNDLGFTRRSGLLLGTDPVGFHEQLYQKKLMPADSLPRLSFTGMAGSEIYDPLLNLYEGTNSINSDHFSQLSGRVILPEQNMTIHGSYSYEDRYSQQFDLFHKEYATLWGTALPMSSYGLAEDLYIAGHYNSSRSKGILTILSYDRWGVLPGFNDRYSYRSGLELLGGGELSKDRVTLTALVGANKYRDQFGHFGDSLFTDIEADLGISYDFNEITSLKLNYQHTENFDSKDLIALKVEQQFSYFYWSLNSGFYIQSGYELDAQIKFDLSESLSFISKFHNGRSLGERERNWLSLDRPLNFSGDSITSLDGSLSLNYSRNELALPFSIAVKSELNRHPRYEQIDTTATHYAVTMGNKADRSVAALGVIAKVSLEREQLGVSIDGKIRADLLDLPPLSSPGFYRIHFRGGRDERRAFQINAIFEHRAPVTQIRMDGKGSVIQDISTGWNSGLTVNLIIPVVSPFLEKRILPTIEMGAGPIRFAREQMVQELPGSNPIGPEVFLKLVGDIIIGG